ncbi:MAG: hypothetical protein Q7T55_22970 [Solirubrobacteraceae bacterium]|nr:hypothetical protein [Solirubrobacteraceae bacterium]
MSRTITHIRLGRTGLLAAGSTFVALAFAAPASASNATLVAGELSIQDSAGNAAVMTVGELSNPLGLPGLDKVLVDTDAPINAPAGCTHPTLLILSDPTAILCDRSAVRRMTIDLGDKDDTVTRPLALNALGTRAAPFSALPIELDGGAGNDHLQGGDGADVLAGEGGDDTLLGFGGDDLLIGGLGADRIEPGSGANTVDVSSPESDTVAFSVGSSNATDASPNDVFLGAIDSAKISFGTPDVPIDAASVQVNAAADVSADVSAEVSLPPVDDLLAGVSTILPSGTAPEGVRLPIQPLVTSLAGIAGRLGVDVRLKVAGILPAGITLDDSGLHIEIGCSTDCEVTGNGVVDTGDDGVVPLQPGSVSIQSTEGKARLNLGIGTEYTKFARPLKAGKCTVVVSRLRVKTSRGTEVISYALPACGAKLTFTPQARPTLTKKRATRRLVAVAACSAECTLAPRFLLVKKGNRVLARSTSVSVRPAPGNAKGTVHTTVWRLTASQEAAITRAGDGRGRNKVRYIVSAKATSGGVTTTGTASFRTRKT